MPRGRPKKTTDDVMLKSAELLGWALGGIEREIAQTQERLAALTAQARTLRQRLGTDVKSAVRRASRGVDAVASQASATVEGTARTLKRKTMSPEARRRISEMMKKRWAERKKQG
jgi:type II secretory pathway component HofQ